MFGGGGNELQPFKREDLEDCDSLSAATEAMMLRAIVEVWPAGTRAEPGIMSPMARVVEGSASAEGVASTSKTDESRDMMEMTDIPGRCVIVLPSICRSMHADAAQLSVWLAN